MGTVAADLRYAIRRLLNTPVFTVSTLVLLAIAIGANTAIFSLLDALSLRALRVTHPEQLVQVAVATPNNPTRDLSASMFREIGRRQRVFSAVIGWEANYVANVETNGELSRVDTWFVTGNFYEELGTRPAIGRLLTTDDDVTAGHAAPVVVLGYDYWQRRFHGDRGVIGRSLRIEGTPFTIVGVAPKHFSGVGLVVEPDLTIPNGARTSVEPASAAESDGQGPDEQGISLIGRLKTGVTLAQASSQLSGVWPRVKESTIPHAFDSAQRAAYLALPLVVRSAERGADEWFRSSMTDALWLTMAGAALILLVACLNLAGLMLSRVALGLHEWNVRAALGATHWQLARPVFIECLVVTLLGACCGLPIASWGVATFGRRSLDTPFPTTTPVSVVPDLRVLVFVSLVALVVGLIVSAGAVAWLRGRHGSLSIRTGVRSTRPRITPVLVTAQVALSLVLITSSALLGRNLQALRGTRDLHYRREGVTVASLNPRPNGYRHVDNDTYQPMLLEKIRTIPGVQSASLGFAPGPGLSNPQPVSPARSRDDVTAQICFVTPGYLQTLEIPLLRGRDVAWRDTSHAPRVVMASQSLSRRLFGDDGAIGRRLRIGSEPRDQDLEVIGIVADVKLFDFRHPTPFAVYVAQLQGGEMANWKDLIIRSNAPVDALSAQVRRAVEGFGHEYVISMQTLQYRTDDELSTEWLVAQLAASFSSLALVLTAIGLYSLLSYAMTVRRKELGIRLALGAEPARLVTFVAADGLRMAVVGIAVGTGATWVTNRLLATMLTGVGAFDPLTMIASPTVLLLVALVACAGPAVRAARIDPIATLRSD